MQQEKVADASTNACVPRSRRVEQLDDLCRALGKGSEGQRNWPPIGERSFVESYLKAEINLCIRPSGDAKQWGAVFQFAGVEGLGGREGSPSIHADSSRDQSDAHKSAVLTHNVKLVERIEPAIPSIVRFELFDCALISVRQPLYFFDCPVYRVNEIERGCGDREVNIFWPYIAVSLGKGDGENVKAAADHINDRARLGVDNERNGLPLADLDKFLAGVTVWLSDREIWATSAPFGDALRQHLDLGYGPINSTLGF